MLHWQTPSLRNASLISVDPWMIDIRHCNQYKKLYKLVHNTFLQYNLTYEADIFT